MNDTAKMILERLQADVETGEGTARYSAAIHHYAQFEVLAAVEETNRLLSDLTTVFQKIADSLGKTKTAK